ncbi:helix-turn-helix domain-containing protein, partial [Aliarcobacter butzleri]
MELKKNMKSDFDAFLKEEDIFEEVNNTAIKKVIAYQIAQEMKQQNITQTELAKMMNTSRTVIHKLLNPENNSLTLQSLQSVANA